MTDRTCGVGDCDRVVAARGMCRMHYKRWWRNYYEPVDPQQLFWEKVKVQRNGCWHWTGYVDTNGYGWVKRNRRVTAAARVAYEFTYGPIPDGLTIDHLCHNGSGCAGGPRCMHRRCVNPDHLEACTQQVNYSRANHSRMGTHCKYGHPWTSESTYTGPNGRHRCRICTAERQRRYSAAKKRTEE